MALALQNVWEPLENNSPKVLWISWALLAENRPGGNNSYKNFKSQQHIIKF